MSLGEFMGEYFSYGLECLVTFGDEKDTCNYSFFYLIGYAMSLFTLQLSLTYLMGAKSTRNARIIFSLMVPLTIGAFSLGTLADSMITIETPDWPDAIALIVVAFGVWLYNWFEEKPQKASIENL